MQLDTGNINPQLDRTIDPGAGGISSIVDVGFKSLQSIGAGEELFISYGEIWFWRRDKIADVPLSKDYQAADKIMASVSSMALQKGNSFVGKSLERLLTWSESQTGGSLFPASLL